MTIIQLAVGISLTAFGITGIILYAKQRKEIADIEAAIFKSFNQHENLIMLSKKYEKD